MNAVTFIRYMKLKTFNIKIRYETTTCFRQSVDAKKGIVMSVPKRSSEEGKKIAARKKGKR